MKKFLGILVILLGLPIQAYAQSSEWMRQPDSSGHAGQFLRSDFTWRNVEFPFSKTSISVADTGATLIGTTASGTARFNVAAVYIMTTDTAGYTSNVANSGVTVGTNASSYQNVVSSGSNVSLRTNGVYAPALSVTRTTIPGGTAIYAHVASGDQAVATSFHVTVTIVGFYDR